LGGSGPVMHDLMAAEDKNHETLHFTLLLSVHFFVIFLKWFF